MGENANHSATRQRLGLRGRVWVAIYLGKAVVKFHPRVFLVFPKKPEDLLVTTQPSIHASLTSSQSVQFIHESWLSNATL